MGVYGIPKSLGEKMHLWFGEPHGLSSSPSGHVASWAPGLYHLGRKDSSGHWPLLTQCPQISSRSPVAPKGLFLVGSTHRVSRCLQGGLNAVSSEWPFGPLFPPLHSTAWASPLSPAPSFVRPPTEHSGANSRSYLERDNTVDYSFLHYRAHWL